MPARRKPPLAKALDKALAAIRPGNGKLRDEQLVAALLSAGHDPLPVLARIASIAVDDPAEIERLAMTWKCRPIEAVAAWERIARLVTPFLHRQQPRGVDVAIGTPDKRLIIDVDAIDEPPVPALPWPAQQGDLSNKR